MTSFPPAAGWYPNPQGAGQRYWDGAAWTSHLQDASDQLPAVASAPMTAAGGWFPDPSGAPLQRWHDGSQWTPHTAAHPGWPATPQYVATTVVVGARKSAGVAFLLTFFFGPVGLFYSSVIGGVIMLVVEFLLFLFGFLTFGFAWALFGLCWLVCIIWGVVAAGASTTTQVTTMR